jgi:ABC-type Mn2+/Zn2+ transport system ATPase subunit
MILSTHNLQIQLGHKEISSTIEDLSIDQGDLLLITGDNGSGKTTFIKTLLGIHPTHNGHIKWKIQQNEIFYLPQLGNIHFFLPIKFSELPFGDLKHANKSWNTSSGGERQQYFLNLAFQLNPKLLILDEPFNHLDQSMRIETILRLKSFLKNKGTIIIISHETNMADLIPNKTLQFEKKSWN